MGMSGSEIPYRFIAGQCGMERPDPIFSCGIERPDPVLLLA